MAEAGFDRAPPSRNLVDVLVHRALHQPGDTAFLFLRDGEHEDGSLTFGELEKRVRICGTALRKRGAAGERVLVLFPQGLDFIVGFLATLYAGAIAVPAPFHPNSRSSRLDGIIDDARPAFALTNLDALAEARKLLSRGTVPPALVSLAELMEEGESDGGGPRVPDYDIPGNSLAFLQFTSGSTKTPKGVMITHANLLHNQRMIEQLYEHTRRTVSVSWLPMFHDMGLVGSTLQPIYVGYKAVVMSPVAFLQEPTRWLDAISRYRATTAGGPNFGYDLCVERTTAEQRKGLDLSSWDVAFNGSEPVRARTLDRFVDTFEPYGFRRSTFYPTYGMAEATLLISGPAKGTEPVIRSFQDSAATRSGDTAETPESAATRIVGCGRTGPGHRLIIVDPVSRCSLPEGQVGEIWFAGPSVSPGYWHRPEESTETFNVALASSEDSSLMRTGDLGYLKDGEIFITGRIKDLIIVRGRNHYPHDIEEAAQTSHPALRLGCGAAFVVEDGETQRLVLANEVRRQYLRKLPLAEIAGSVRAAVARQHGLQVSEVVLLKTATIPKTSSGKVQRSVCKAKLLDGALDIVGEDRYGAVLRNRTQSSELKQTAQGETLIEEWQGKVR